MKELLKAVMDQMDRGDRPLRLRDLHDLIRKAVYLQEKKDEAEERAQEDAYNCLDPNT